MADYSKQRIFGYVFTIFLHVGNSIVMHSPKSEDVLSDPQIQLFASLTARFLTVWTFWLQVFVAVLGLSYEILVLLNSRNKNSILAKCIKEVRDDLFCGILFPSVAVVSTFFWSIFMYDRSLVFPDFLDKIIGPISNHIVHTAILPIGLWELFYQPRDQPRPHVKYVSFGVMYFFLYVSVLIGTYYEKGIWIYPVLKEIYGTIYFFVFIVGTLVVGLSVYSLQWYLVNLFWKSTEKPKKKARKFQ